MYDFELKIPTEIYFGENVEKTAGEHMREYASDVLVLYGSERVFDEGSGNDIVASLEDAGCKVAKLGGVRPNADTGFIDRAIQFVRARKLNGILAVGGGSVIDSAKAIAAGVCCRAPVAELYRGEAEPGMMLPVGAVVTMPASGSEANGMSVVTDHATGEKLSRYFLGVIPKFALLDPKMTVSIPPYQTAVGGFDIFSHAFERFFDLRRDSVLLDEMTASLMRTVVKVLPGLVRDPGDLSARGEIMYAATVAHSNMLGPGGDFACHAMSHILTHNCGLPHGGALAMLIPAWCRYMKKYDEERFRRFYEMVFDTSDIQEGETRLEDFVTRIGLPLKPENSGLTPEELAEETLKGNDHIGAGFCPMGREDVEAVYRSLL